MKLNEIKGKKKKYKKQKAEEGEKDANDRGEREQVQWTHLQLISFAIAPLVLRIVHLLKRRSGGAIASFFFQSEQNHAGLNPGIRIINQNSGGAIANESSVRQIKRNRGGPALPRRHVEALSDSYCEEEEKGTVSSDNLED
jgi:hypothetical protein